jgi:hypothetical protein
MNLTAAAGAPPSEPRRVEPPPPHDDNIFDEKTDQSLKGPGRQLSMGAAIAPSTGTHRRVTDRGTGGGLRRVASASQGLPRGSGPGRKQKPTDPELGLDAAPKRTLGSIMGRRGGDRSGGWSLATMVMAGVAAVLALFIVWRLATKTTPPAPDIDGDPQLVLGQALSDLAEGRRDAARSALARLAVERAAASEALATLALIHYEDRRLVEAEALFERLVERNPRDAVTLAWLGLVQAERNDPQRAAVSFARARQGAKGPLAERLGRLVSGAGGDAPLRGEPLAPEAK